MVFDPNSHLLAEGRDAAKNVFTLAWQLAHGGGVEFEGMAWPHGEHVCYTDGHPLLAWVVGGLPFDARWTAGLLHLLIVGSWAAAAAVLTWLLNRFRVEGWSAVVLGAAVALMHPQVLRWSGHYALAYSVVLPGVWALCIRWADRPGWGRAAAVGGAIAAALFTHAYLGAIAAAFAGVLLAGMWVAYRPTSLHAAAGATFVATVLPLLLFRGFIALTDGHGLRTDNPYGFWDNVSTWDALWLPSHGPLGSVRQTLGTGLTAWEGWGHVGTGAVVALAVWMGWRLSVRLRLGLSLGTRDGVGSVRDEGEGWGVGASVAACAAAAVCVAIGVGEPFLTGRDVWLEALPIFKQFRAVGRFVWPAAFVLPVVGAWAVGQVRRPRTRQVLLGLYAAVYAAEALLMQAELRRQTHPVPNPFAVAAPDVVALEQVAEGLGAVALHPLPWFHLGSEAVGREGTVAGHRAALAAAFHTGLPLTAAHLTRTGVGEARDLMGLSGHPGLQRRIAVAGIDAGSVVVVWAADGAEGWTAEDRAVWERARPTADARTRWMTWGDWMAVEDGRRAEVAPEPAADDLAWNGFDDRAGGVASGVRYEYLLLDTLRPDSGWLRGPVEVACWFRHDGYREGQNALDFLFVAEAEWEDGTREWVASTPAAAGVDHLSDARGEWTRAAVRLDLAAAGKAHSGRLPRALYIFTIGHGPGDETVVADALRVRRP